MLPRSSSGYLYTVLQVDRNASEDAIRRQYRRLAMQFHPDRTGGRTTEHFKEIEEAHRVLADADQRVLYDAVGRTGLKQLGDYGVPRFMRSLSALQASMFLTGCVLAALLLAMALTCYKLDHPQAAHKLPWGLVLLPLWVLCPLFLLGGSLVCLAAVGTPVDWQSLVRGMQMLALGAVSATTAAALSGMLAPLWALLSWLLVQLFSTVQQMYLFKPSAYCRCYEQHAPHRHTDDTSPLQPPTSTNTPPRGRRRGDADVWGDDNGYDGDGSGMRRPVRMRYLGYVVCTLFENACVWAFFALALTRAMQGGRASDAVLRAGTLATVDHADYVASAPMHTRRMREVYGVDSAADVDTDDNDNASSLRKTHHVLSFYVVALPLVLLFAVRTMRAMLQPCMAHARPARSSLSAAAAATTRTTTADGAHMPLLPTDDDRHDDDDGDDDDLLPSSTFAERVCASVLYSIVPAAMLYMTCMWASKAEHEYNGNKRAYDPTAMMATLPILLLLALLTLTAFVAMCLVAMFVKGMYHHSSGGGSARRGTDAYTAATAGGNAAQPMYTSAANASDTTPTATRGGGPAATAHAAAHAPRERNMDID